MVLAWAAAQSGTMQWNACRMTCAVYIDIAGRVRPPTTPFFAVARFSVPYLCSGCSAAVRIMPFQDWPE